MDHAVPSAGREAALAFGPFHYRPATRTLETDDRHEVLPPRVGTALEAFLARPGQTLSKQELVEEIWSGAWVSDTALTEAISLLRQALGDDPRNPSFILTVRGRGYRFLPPVEETAPPAPVEGMGVAGPRPVTGPEPGWARIGQRPASLLLAASAALLLVAAIVGIRRAERPAPSLAAPTVRFAVPLPSLDSVPRLLPLMAVSPDGRRIVVAGKDADGQGRLWSRDLDRLKLAPIDGTEIGLGAFFSPDGRSIAYFRGASLLRVPLAGGAPRTVAEGGLWKGGTWLEDGTIVVGGTGGGGLGRVPADGGAIETLTTIDADRGELGALVAGRAPREDKVLFTVVGSLPADSQIAVLDLATGRRQTLVDDGWSPRFLPPDRLLSARGNRVMEVPLDVSAGRVTGPPRQALDGVASLPGTSAQFDVSPTGTLAYLQGPPADCDAELVRVDNGRVAEPVVPEVRRFDFPAIDATTGRIAVAITDDERSDLWIVEDGGLRPLTFSGTSFLPVWVPGGEALYFSSNRDGSLDLYRKAADGASPATRVLAAPEHLYAQSASPDGRWLVYALIDAETGWDLWRLGQESAG